MNKLVTVTNGCEPASTRERILDSAEELFSLQGFEGATLRQITRKADVPLGLANHYFGTKEQLFREIIQRRAVTHIADMEAALDAVERLPHPTNEDYVRAYVAPLLLRSASGDPGWKNYCRLLGLTLNSVQYKAYARSTLTLFDHTLARVVNGVRSINPGCDERQLHWCLYFLHSAVTHVLTEAGMVDRQSGGLCKSSDLETIIEEMLPFFGAAFASRLAPTP